MSNNYNQKIMIHKFSIEGEMNAIAAEIRQRGIRHDISKQSGLELSCGKKYMSFHDSWKMTRNTIPDEMIAAMGHHYAENDHHPEHFQNGMQDMTLSQLTEMVCDIISTAKENSIPFDKLESFMRDRLSPSYDIGEPLISIMINTARQSYNRQ